ncbi:MAG TPA: acyl-CoA dehydrogenase family protein [Acidimicrobiia bacterium]|nr:acyl-CoA dehydrogenase family protein [Acidimicrobiia bacterium]
MDPRDSEEEAAFRAEARSWLERNARLRPRPAIVSSAIVAEWSPEEEESRFQAAVDWQRLKSSEGWAGIAWPTKYGGRGAGLVESVIFDEEETRFDLSRDALSVGLGWCGPAVLAHGSEEQRDRFLPPLLRGDEVWCQLFSEPDAGSDVAGLRTRAVRDGEEWVLSGQKAWTTFAHRSDWGLCIARTDSALPKHRGLTAFVVDMHDPGVRCNPLVQMTGSSNFNEVFLDEVVVPDDRVVGGVGQGWSVVITTFMFERIGVIFDTEGLVEALKHLIGEKGAGDRRQVRERFARVAIGSRILQFHKLRLLTSLAQGRTPGPEGSVVKLAATRFLSEAYELGLYVLGPAATVIGSGEAAEWLSAFLGAPGLRIGGGTDEVQKNIVGERVLGLPGEPRPDRDLPFATGG